MSWVGWIPVPPGEIRARLRGAIARGAFAGEVGQDRFELRPTRSASGRPPRIVGRYTSAEGTVVEAEVLLDPLAQLGALVGWAPGVQATSTEVTEALAELADSVGVAATGDEAWRRAGRVGDPASPGAETSSPRSFHASITPEEVRFLVSGADRPLLGPARTLVTVTSAHLRVDGRRLAWEDVGPCAARDDALVVGELVVPADGHRPWEIRWLAGYLDARAARRRRSEGERARDAEDRADLEALLDRKP